MNRAGRGLRPRIRTVGFPVLIFLTVLIAGCGSEGASSSGLKYEHSFTQLIVAEPPTPAPFSNSDPGEKSLAYATTVVPDGWGLIGASESISEVVLPSGVRTDRTRTLFYGPDRGRRIGFTISSLVQFSGDDEVIDAVFVDCPSSGYAAMWQCDGAILTVESFDATIDRSSVQSGVYEISEQAFQGLVLDLGRPKVIVGSDAGSSNGRKWEVKATIPIDLPSEQRGGVAGCIEFGSSRTEENEIKKDEPVCASRIGPTSNATVVRRDGTNFVLGVLRSSADSFLIRNTSPDHPATARARVIISDVDTSLRWIVAPLDESMTECLTIESEDGESIDGGDGAERSSLRVGIAHSIPYGYCDFGTEELGALGPAVRWDAARSGTFSDLSAAGLVVSFIGSPEVRDSSDRCGVTYVAQAQESETEVTVTVHPVLSHLSDEESEPVACQAVGAMRIAEVTLVTPLGSRTVRDGSVGEVREVFDSSNLLSPVWLPPGFTLTSEYSAPFFPGFQAWQRVWSRSSTDRLGSGPTCLSTTQHIAFTQIQGQFSPEVMPWERVLPSESVKGQTVSVYAQTSDENAFLQLRVMVGNQSLKVDGTADCMGGSGPSLKELLRVLDSALT